MHFAIKCDMIDLLENTLKSTVFPCKSISHFLCKKVKTYQYAEKHTNYANYIDFFIEIDIMKLKNASAGFSKGSKVTILCKDAKND